LKNQTTGRAGSSIEIPAGARPALITDGGSPLVVAPDGNLYYVCNDERMIPGGLQIGRLSPDGKLELVAPGIRKLAEELGGIKGPPRPG
jgi:hypothetical protein